MNKRKININDLKRNASRRTHLKTIDAKYETMLPYFKNKGQVDYSIFKITDALVIVDLLDQLVTTELATKTLLESKDSIQ